MNIFEIDGKIGICDIGASSIEPTPFIEKLLNNTASILYGFEPNEIEFNKLQVSENKKFFKSGIGNGEKQILNICKAPGMTSILEPKLKYLSNFHNFDEWAKVVDKVEIETTKLDDIDFDQNIDFFKIDVQGYEAEIIKHGKKKLESALCVVVETSTVPIYEGEKPFWFIAQQLEELGFILHAFDHINTRAFKPLVFGNNPYIGLNHIFQLDCIFIKNIEDLSKYQDDELKKLALILFHCFGSYDLVHYLISELDKRHETNLIESYMKVLQGNTITLSKKY